MAETAVNVSATIGGAEQNISLSLNANDISSYYDTVLANGLNPAFAVTVVYDDPNVEVSASTVADGTEFQPLVLASSTQAVTISGGELASSLGAINIVSNGGLNYVGSGNTNEVVSVVGGNSYISLAATTGIGVVHLSSGHNTVVSGSGPILIDAGTGANSIFGGSGTTLISSEGRDSIQLAGGNSSIYVNALGESPDVASAIVYGETNPTVKSSIYFEADGVNASTVYGGSSGSDTFLAGAGGGYFQAGSGGGNQLDAGSGAVTLIGGQSGGDTLNGSAGSYETLITLPTEAKGDLVSTGAGNSTVYLLGTADTVDAGSGSTTVGVATSALVYAGSGSLWFASGSGSSTVVGGTGSETIFGGLGGGVFNGGSGGDNLLLATSAATTLSAGGANDTLVGGSAGKDEFAFLSPDTNVSYTVFDFVHTDTLFVKSAADQSYALAHLQVVGGSTLVSLKDGTNISLVGYTGALTSGNFKHS